MCRIMSFAKWWFYFFLSIWIPFVSFSCLSAVARLKILCWRKVVRGYSFLVPELRGNAFRFSPLNIMLAVGLSYMAFIVLKYVPSLPTFWNFFLNHECWILSKAFYVSIGMITQFLFFNLLVWCITLTDWMGILNYPCIMSF